MFATKDIFDSLVLSFPWDAILWHALPSPGDPIVFKPAPPPERPPHDQWNFPGNSAKLLKRNPVSKFFMTGKFYPRPVTSVVQISFILKKQLDSEVDHTVESVLNSIF